MRNRELGCAARGFLSHAPEMRTDLCAQANSPRMIRTVSAPFSSLLDVAFTPSALPLRLTHCSQLPRDRSPCTFNHSLRLFFSISFLLFLHLPPSPFNRPFHLLPRARRIPPFESNAYGHRHTSCSVGAVWLAGLGPTNSFGGVGRGEEVRERNGGERGGRPLPRTRPRVLPFGSQQNLRVIPAHMRWPFVGLCPQIHGRVRGECRGQHCRPRPGQDLRVTRRKLPVVQPRLGAELLHTKRLDRRQRRWQSRWPRDGLRIPAVTRE